MLTLLAITVLATSSSSDLATANPDAPALEVGWRDGMRAKGGGRIRLIGEREDAEGAVLHLFGFFEMHNEPRYPGWIPYQNWRGRIALEGGYQFKFDGPTAWVLRLTLGAEHESDHSTAANLDVNSKYFGFVNLNSVAVRARIRHGVVAPTHLEAIGRLHLLTCTSDPAYCADGGGMRGDRTFEGELWLAQELSLSGNLSQWNAFVAAWGALTAAAPLVTPARRVAIRAGIIFHRRSDAIAFFFQAFNGTHLGYFRQSEGAQVGLGLAWTPD